MKKILLFFVIFSPFVSNAQRKTTPLPDEIIIGNHSYIDVGPSDFYSIERITRNGEGILIERVSMTPSYRWCYGYATANIKTKKSAIDYDDMFEGANPCDFSLKKVTQEAKRKPNMPNFAGSIETLQFSCGNERRILKAIVFESDIFLDPRAKTPSFTAWFMNLTSRLDKETDTKLWSEPILNLDPMNSLTIRPHEEPDILKDVAQGKYDGLFAGADLPLQMYHDAQQTIGKPVIQLVSSTPLMPDSIKLPVYPPIAKAASVNGNVIIDFKIGEDCKPVDLQVKSGPKMLEQASENAINESKYCLATKGLAVEAEFAFNLNCKKDSH